MLSLALHLSQNTDPLEGLLEISRVLDPLQLLDAERQRVVERVHEELQAREDRRRGTPGRCRGGTARARGSPSRLGRASL